MHPFHAELLEQFKQAIAPPDGPRKGRVRICVICGAGHGDHMRGIAIARCAKAAWKDTHVTAVLHFNGCMTEWDIGYSAVQAGAIDRFAVVHMPVRELAIPEATALFDVTIDAVPYPVAVHYNLDSPALGTVAWKAQVAAEQRLSQFRVLHDMHPYGYNALRLKPMTQWDIARATSGLPVSEDDMLAPTEAAPDPSETELVRLALGTHPESLLGNIRDRTPRNPMESLIGTPRYVVVHNAAGGMGKTKCANPDMFKAIRARLIADGIACVQVGCPDDERIPETIDRRGLRVPFTCGLVKGSLGVVAVEGFLPYLGVALRKPTVVLFGPTPHETFAFAPTRALSLVKLMVKELGGNLREERTPCPLGSCFWRTERWAARCPLDADNPCNPYCMNFWDPDPAAQIVARYITEHEGGVA